MTTFYTTKIVHYLYIFFLVLFFLFFFGGGSNEHHTCITGKNTSFQLWSKIFMFKILHTIVSEAIS